MKLEYIISSLSVFSTVTSQKTGKISSSENHTKDKQVKIPSLQLLPPKLPKSSKKDERNRHKENSKKILPSIIFSKVIFEDNFDELDFDKWRPEITAGGGGSWEFQYYDNDRHTSYVKDGNLHLKPVLTADLLEGGNHNKIMEKGYTLDLYGNAPGKQCTSEGFFGCKRESQYDSIINPVASAQLRSVNSFSFKYGQVKVRAKMPKGDWLWPAIWLLPKHHAYGGWPASGEIDIVESRGNEGDCFGDGVSTVSSALHWGVDPSQNKFDQTYGKATLKQGKTFNDGFYEYTMEWTKDYIRTWVNNHLIMNVEFKKPNFEAGKFKGDFNPWQDRKGNNAPFDQKFYLILNLAVGGTEGYFNEALDTTKPPSSKKNKFRWDRCKKNPPKYQKPWINKQNNATRTFLMNRDKWYPTWNSKTDQSHLIIDYIKVLAAP